MYSYDNYSYDEYKQFKSILKELTKKLADNPIIKNSSPFSKVYTVFLFMEKEMARTERNIKNGGNDVLSQESKEAISKEINKNKEALDAVFLYLESKVTFEEFQNNFFYSTFSDTISFAVNERKSLKFNPIKFMDDFFDNIKKTIEDSIEVMGVAKDFNYKDYLNFALDAKNIFENSLTNDSSKPIVLDAILHKYLKTPVLKEILEKTNSFGDSLNDSLQEMKDSFKNIESKDTENNIHDKFQILKTEKQDGVYLCVNFNDVKLQKLTRVYFDLEKNSWNGFYDKEINSLLKIRETESLLKAIDSNDFNGVKTLIEDNLQREKINQNFLSKDLFKKVLQELKESPINEDIKEYLTSLSKDSKKTFSKNK